MTERDAWMDAYFAAHKLAILIEESKTELQRIAEEHGGVIRLIAERFGIQLAPENDQYTIYDFPEDPPSVRRSDPATSTTAARSVAVRRNSQKGILLALYAEPEYQVKGLASFEAGDLSGLSKNPACCYWKRISELAHADLIRANGEIRVNPLSDEKQLVYAITEKGRALARNLQPQP